MNVLVLIEIPMPHDAEHGDQSVHGVVRQTPIPSPASFTLAELIARFSSTSPSSVELKDLNLFSEKIQSKYQI